MTSERLEYVSRVDSLIAHQTSETKRLFCHKKTTPKKTRRAAHSRSLRRHPKPRDSKYVLSRRTSATAARSAVSPSPPPVGSPPPPRTPRRDAVRVDAGAAQRLRVCVPRAQGDDGARAAGERRRREPKREPSSLSHFLAGFWVGRVSKGSGRSRNTFAVAGDPNNCAPRFHALLVRAHQKRRHEVGLARLARAARGTARARRARRPRRRRAPRRARPRRHRCARRCRR